MSQEYRTLSGAFIQAMERRWPVYKTLRETHGLKFKNDDYRDMKTGGAVPANLITGVVRTILRMRGDAVEEASREAVREFMAAHGQNAPLELADEAMLSVVCDSDAPLAVSAPARSDFLLRGFGGLTEFLKARFTRYIESKVTNCSAEEVPTAIRWMYVAAARYALEQPSLDMNDAVQRAEEIMRISEADYVRAAAAWREHFPWSIVFVKGRERPAGMTIVLPLARNTADALLNGEMPTYACKPEQLVTPTDTVLIEAVAERPSDQSSGPTRVTSALYYALLAQVAALTRSQRLVKDTPLRMLSFSASPLARKRLIAYGYKLTGKYMHTTGVEFLERTLSRSGKDFLPRAAIDMLSAMLDTEPLA